MGTLADVGLVLLVALGMPLRALIHYRELRAMTAAEAGARRPGFYRRAMAWQWAIVGLVAWRWAATGRDPSSLGFSLEPNTGWLGVGLGLLFVLPALLRQRLTAPADPVLREKLADRLRSAERILPRTTREHLWFVPLALTAGICEELLFRGFLVWGAVRFVPLLAAHALVAVLFGAGHAYQGRGGMVRTGLVGAFFSGVVLVTGSVVPAMVMHALLDLLAGDLGRRVLEPPPARDPAAGA